MATKKETEPDVKAEERMRRLNAMAAKLAFGDILKHQCRERKKYIICTAAGLINREGNDIETREKKDLIKFATLPDDHDKLVVCLETMSWVLDKLNKVHRNCLKMSGDYLKASLKSIRNALDIETNPRLSILKDQ